MRLLFIGKWLDKIKFKKSGYLSDAFLFWCFAASVFFLAAAAGAIEFLLSGNDEFISLHYNIYTGIDRAGQINEMWFYVLAGFLFFAFNGFFSYRFFKKGDIFISRLTAVFNAGILFLLVLAVFHIILLNK